MFARKSPGLLALALGAVSTLAAAGTSKTDAAQMLTPCVKVTGANSANGVLLPAGGASDASSVVMVINASATDNLLVYPESGGTIDDAAADAPVTLFAGERGLFVLTAARTWYALVV